MSKKICVALISILFFVGCSSLKHPDLGKFRKSVLVFDFGKSNASGFIAGKNSDGDYVALSVGHAVQDKNVSCEIRLHDGTKVNGIIQTTDFRNFDVSIITFKYKEYLPPIKLAEKQKDYEKVWFGGYPAVPYFQMNSGYLNDKKVPVRVWTRDKQFVNIPWYPGISGSPLINREGNLVGVMLGGARNWKHLAVVNPLSDVKKFLNTYDEEIIDDY